MIINPIIPIWIMTIVCILLFLLKRKGTMRYIMQCVMIILLFVTNLGISIPNGNVIVNDRKIDAKVLFVIDNTISMQANDGRDGAKRFANVKSDCQAIIDYLDGAKFSVLSYNNETTINCPYTNNSQHAKNVIAAITPIADYYAKGSSMNICKTVMKETLERTYDDGGKTIVFFISDGEITNESVLESFEDCRELISGGAVLGYGTEKGGEMFVSSIYDNNVERAIMDSNSGGLERAVSKIDEKNLKAIAKDLGLAYWRMDDEKIISDNISEVRKGMEEKIEKSNMKGYTNISFLFVIPFLVLLIIEIIDIKKRGI